MHRRPLLHMILALSLVTFVGALVVGFADYPQRYLVDEQGDGADGGAVTAGLATRELSCPGPLRDRAAPLAERAAVVWPRVDHPCDAEREARRAGVWLTLAFSTITGATALALLRRDGPEPDLDPPQPHPVTREVPDL